MSTVLMSTVLISTVLISTGFCHICVRMSTVLSRMYNNEYYGVALDSKIDKIIGLFCKRAL